jgi:hypothetical protein
VSTLEDKLRDAFRADAQTIRPDTIPAITVARGRPAARRARLLIPVAAAMATAAIAAGVWGTSSLLHSRSQSSGATAPYGRGAVSRPVQHNPAPAAGGPLPEPVLGQQAPRAVPASTPARGLPRFLVTDEPANVPHADDLLITSTETGKIAGIVRPPRGKFFGSLTATAGDRTFVAAVMPDNAQPCVNQLYQFQVTASGQPGPLVALHIAVPGNFNEPDTLTITPDGRTIAYASYICGRVREEYGVIDLATRRVRIWGTGIIAPAVGDGFPAGLSLSADGRLLAFAEVGGPARILSTGARPGSILDRSRILSGDSYWVALAGDESAFYGCTMSPPPASAPPHGSLTYFWQTIGGNPGRHVFASWPDVSSPQCLASLDPSGRYLLIQLPVGHGDLRPVIDLRTGRTTPVPVGAYLGQNTTAW